jgi:Na+/phosphate symporter
MTLTTISQSSSASSKLLVASTVSGIKSPGKNRSLTRRFQQIAEGN